MYRTFHRTDLLMIDESKNANLKKMMEFPDPNFQRFCLRRWLFHVTRGGDHAVQVTGESIAVVCNELRRLERAIQE